jgi:hypothetical protein
MPQAWNDFRQEALAYGTRHGHDANDMRRVLDDLNGQWGPTRVYGDLMAAFGDDGMATHLSRAWKSAGGRVQTKAENEAKRLFFTGYERGGIEKGLKRVFLFHYFTSRQTALYASQALHHPGIMNAYINATQGFDRYVPTVVRRRRGDMVQAPQGLGLHQPLD